MKFTTVQVRGARKDLKSVFICQPITLAFGVSIVDVQQFILNSHTPTGPHIATSKQGVEDPGMVHLGPPKAFPVFSFESTSFMPTENFV